MTIPSIPTRGRTLDYAASVYDLLEPLCLLSKQAEYGLTILDTNLQFPLELNGIRDNGQKQRIDELLATFDLSGYDKALPGELSGGETQRIAFARAIAHKPALLLADEPTASLDSATGNQLIQLMLSLCAHQHTTLIIATHDPELMEMTDHKIYLKDGRMETKS